MPFDNSTLSMPEIEALEHKYLMKYWFFLKFCEEEMVNGLQSMDEIRADWDGLYGGTPILAEENIENYILFPKAELNDGEYFFLRAMAIKK